MILRRDSVGVSGALTRCLRDHLETIWDASWWDRLFFLNGEPAGI